MRSRDRIEKEFNSCRSSADQLTLEVCLDIRELLQEKEKPKSNTEEKIREAMG